MSAPMKAEPTTPNKKRVKGISLERAIVHGSIAWPLGKKAEEGKTHKWVCYVRGYNNEDVSYYIQKVVFTLHPSFINPKRVVERFPFEIYESGWGEFEISIKIYFVDPAEKPVDIFHPLKLYPASTPAPEEIPQVISSKPIVVEYYDEIVFNQPHEDFHALLLDNDPPPMPTRSWKLSEYFTPFNEIAEIKKIQEAHRKVKGEIAKLREKIEQMDSEMNSLSKEEDDTSYSEDITPME